MDLCVQEKTTQTTVSHLCQDANSEEAISNLISCRFRFPYASSISNLSFYHNNHREDSNHFIMGLSTIFESVPLEKKLVSKATGDTVGLWEDLI